MAISASETKASSRSTTAVLLPEPSRARLPHVERGPVVAGRTTATPRAGTPIVGEWAALEELYTLLRREGLRNHAEAFLSALTDTLAAWIPANVPGLGAQEAAALARGLTDLPHDESAVARALGRTAAHNAQLRAESLSVPETAAQLRVTAARVRQMLLSGALYGFKVRGSWAIPAFQFVGGKVIPHLAPVVASLPTAMHPLSVERWFTLPNPDLRGDGDQAMSPRDWLAAGGDPDPVVRLAHDL